MKTPEIPSAPHDALTAGQHWAEERAHDTQRDEYRNLMRKLYLAGVMLWHVHRRQVQARVEQGGGIVKTHSALGGRDLNYAELADGSNVYASNLLTTPSLTLSQTFGETEATHIPYMQTHKLHIGFGGGFLGGKAERGWFDINEQPFSGIGFKELVSSDTFFPEEFGVVERVKTVLQTGEDSMPVHTDKTIYSLYGKVWGINPFFAPVSMPDPYDEPMAYRNWALRTEYPQLDLMLQAPVRTNGATKTTTVIDKYGSFQPSGEVAVASLERFRALLGYYAYTQYPDIFPNQDLAIEAPTFKPAQA